MASGMPGIMDFIKELTFVDRLFKRGASSLDVLKKTLNQAFEPRYQKISMASGQTRFKDKATGQFVKTPASGVAPKTAFEKITGGFGKALAAPFKMIGKGASLAYRPLQALGGGILRMAGVPKSNIKALGSAMGGIGKAAMAGMGMGIALQILMQLLAALNPFKDLMAGLTEIFGVYGNILSEAFVPLMDKLFQVMLSPTAIGLVQALSNAMLHLMDGLLPLVDILAPLVGLVMTAMVMPLQLLAPILNLLLIPLKILAPFFGLITDAIGPLTPLLEGVSNTLMAFSDALVNGILKFVLPAVDKISAFFKRMWNGVVSIANQGIGWLNEKLGLNISPIPQMATGGLVRRPTIALIGERGPERVVPAGGSADTYNQQRAVTIVINGRAGARELAEVRRQAWLDSLL